MWVGMAMLRQARHTLPVMHRMIQKATATGCHMIMVLITPLAVMVMVSYGMMQAQALTLTVIMMTTPMNKLWVLLSITIAVRIV